MFDLAFVSSVPYFLHIEPSLDALSLRSDVISLIQILSPGPHASRESEFHFKLRKLVYLVIHGISST